MWVEKRETGFKFIERYTDPMTGKAKRISVVLDKNTSSTRKLAQSILNDKINAALEASDASNLTFGTLVDKYLAYQQKNVKASTYARNSNFCSTLKSILTPDILVSKLSARYIREQLDRTGKANGTKNEFIKRLKALLRWGYRNDYIENIAYLDKLTPYPDISAKQHVEDKYLERDEISRLLLSMEKSGCSQWMYLTEFLLLSGLRIGEAIALTKNDIDEDVIHITKTYDTNNHLVTSPKTAESVRDVFIQKELAETLQRIRIYNRENKISGILLFSDKGEYLSYDNYRLFLRRHSQKSLGRIITPHALRHTHASLLLVNGISIDAISRRLGHSDSQVTKEIYLHIMDQLKERDKDNLRNISLM
ncbi:MAG: site-specific integrase [Bacteroidales bacterium]|nr:site-specific integrase [Roseburia sp.]MCM1205032.1 site-specific integrase [Bacteroidales bacterium]